MRIVAGLQVFEEIDFIESCVRSCCDLFERIVVVEGSWSNTASFASKRSSDGTIEKIQQMLTEYDNLELHFFNGNNQIEHRQFIWEQCKKHKPDWYLQGDGDEIFHEKDKATIRETLSSHRTLDAIAPEHYLFWHDLAHYEKWNTAGARFFGVSNLELNNVISGPQCNMMQYKDKLFHRYTTENFFIYHPSYVKNHKRQLLKIQHRTADDHVQFPHFLYNNKIYRGTVADTENWMDSLLHIDQKLLPVYLQ